LNLIDTNAIIRCLGTLFVDGLHIERPSADTDLFETGILDSLQLVELLLQLEQHFGFKLRLDDIDLDDLRTLARIARLVAACTAGSASGMEQLSSLAVRHAVANEQTDKAERRPRGAEPRTGRADTNCALAIGAPRDAVAAEQQLPLGSVRW
jgi:D-alanine--poly(phosphoribitol) ligase subunit 2